MKKYLIDPRTKIKDITIENVVFIFILCLSLIFILNNMNYVLDVLTLIYKSIIPFLYGVIFAFIFNIPMRFFKKHLPKKNNKERKLLSALISLSFILVLVLFIGFVIVPQIIENISIFIVDFPSIMLELESLVTELLYDIGMQQENILNIQHKIDEVARQIMRGLERVLPYVKDIFFQMIESVMNIGIGIVVAIYLTISKEKLLHQCKTVCTVLLPNSIYIKAKKNYYLITKVFHDFVSGQLTEAFIVGVLCYFGCIILKIPYASTCALVIGCMNIIPYFGPFVGTAVCSIIIFFTSPIHAIVFIIFGTVLQQFESNFIYPHVVGTSVGLSPLLTLVTITISGNLFGIKGMILGLPIVSISYELFNQYIIDKKNTINKHL